MMPRPAHLMAFIRALTRDETLRLSAREAQVLGEVVAAPAPVSGRDLAVAIGISGSQLSRIADRLVGRGFIARLRDTGADRRLAYLEPTAAGRAADRLVARHYAATRGSAA